MQEHVALYLCPLLKLLSRDTMALHIQACTVRAGSPMPMCPLLRLLCRDTMALHIQACTARTCSPIPMCPLLRLLCRDTMAFHIQAACSNTTDDSHWCEKVLNMYSNMEMRFRRLLQPLSSSCEPCVAAAVPASRCSCAPPHLPAESEAEGTLSSRQRGHWLVEAILLVDTCR